MVYDEALASRVRAALATQPDVTEKKMFGGVTFMLNGQMACGVLKNDLIVKVGAERNDEALEDPNARPFDFTGRPMVGMVYVAPGGLRSDRELNVWIQRAINNVSDHPRSDKPSGRRRRG